MRSEYSTDFLKDMDPVLSGHYQDLFPFCREAVLTTMDEITRPEFFEKVFGLNSHEYDLEAMLTGWADPFRSYLQRSGKLLRPYLVCLCLEAYGVKPESRKREVALAEVVHSSSLMLDDISDDSMYRRGDLTAHQRIGMKIAGASASAWLNIGFELLWQDHAQLGRATIDSLMQELAWEHFVTGLGTVIDVTWACHRDFSCQPNAYLQSVVHRSTSYTYRLPLKIGALTAGAPEEDVKGLGHFGETIGLAFQLIDDILNVKPQDPRWGKEIAEDIAQGKLTLQVMLALERADANSRKKLLWILESGTHDQVLLQEAVAILEETGALDEARRIADGFIAEGKRALDTLGSMPDIYRHRLKSFADYVAHRNR